MQQQLRDRFPLTDHQWMYYSTCFRQIKVPAKTILLREGAISPKMFLVEKGCLRAWVNNDGRDTTFQFFFEGNSVASIESFWKELPSTVSIETIEPSVLWYIHKNDFDSIINEIKNVPDTLNKLIDTLLERSIDYMKHSLSFIKDTPEQRYIRLLMERQEVIHRIPQHYIASFLGISSVHLSRIKNKIFRKNS